MTDAAVLIRMEAKLDELLQNAARLRSENRELRAKNKVLGRSNTAIGRELAQMRKKWHALH